MMQKEKSRISRLLLTNGKHITAETVNTFLKALNRYTFGYVGHTAFVWFWFPTDHPGAAAVGQSGTEGLLAGPNCLSAAQICSTT